MNRYGMISQVDAVCIEKTLDLICNEFPHEVINTTEIGIFDGGTSRGIYKYLSDKDRTTFHTAIDNNKDKEVSIPFVQCTFIIGNSNEVYNQLADGSQHFIFVDACHCFAHVILDFFCYVDKVRVGGYFAFHDTGKQIKPFKDFQHGDKNNPDAYISVRKALDKIGILEDWNGLPSALKFYKQSIDNWELVFDEADPNDEAGGICVFKKLY